MPSRRRNPAQQGVGPFATFAAVCSLLLLCDPPAARAACPEEPFDCLGAAGQFVLVTEGKAGLLSQFVGEGFGISYWTWTDVNGDVCAEQINAVSPPFDALAFETSIRNAAVLADSGLGVRARTAASIEPLSVGLSAQTIATAGSSVGPLVDAQAIDTSGEHPLLDACRAAQIDARAAAATFAALPATRDLGSVVLAKDEVRVIPVDPGLNVFDADAIRVGLDALLLFSGSGVTGIIVRTPKLVTRKSGGISGQSLLFLLEGKGPGVSIGQFSDLLGVAILAPDRSVRVGGDGSAERIYASKATLRGTFMETNSWEP
jgi:hypothetical protein